MGFLGTSGMDYAPLVHQTNNGHTYNLGGPLGPKATRSAKDTFIPH